MFLFYELDVTLKSAGRSPTTAWGGFQDLGIQLISQPWKWKRESGVRSLG